MTAAKYYLACLWGAAAFYLLCYGVFNKSANAMMLFAALAPLLVVFILWMVDRAALERRIRRLEAHSDFADEKRVVARADLAEVQHKLLEVETRVTTAENSQTRVEIEEQIPGRNYGKRQL